MSSAEPDSCSKKRAVSSLFAARFRWVVAGIVLSLAGVVASVARPIMAPSATAVEHGELVDAVVVLAGGNGERLTAALDLMEAEVAPVLVVSLGNQSWVGRAERDRLCAEPQAFTVICREVVPDNTVGEARQLSQLAEDEQWSSIGLVTSTYHLHRATVLFARCFDGSVLPYDAAARPNGENLAHESLGILYATLIARTCGDST